MTRPVSEWQWTDDPAIFWLRMEHLPPSKADLAIESLPPTPRPLKYQRTISDQQLKECLREARTVAWEDTRNRKLAAVRRNRTRTTTQIITDRQTAIAERILGINHKEQA